MGKENLMDWQFPDQDTCLHGNSVQLHMKMGQEKTNGQFLKSPQKLSYCMDRWESLTQNVSMLLLAWTFYNMGTLPRSLKNNFYKVHIKCLPSNM